MALSDYWRGKGSAIKPIEIKNFIEAANSLVKYAMPQSHSRVNIAGLDQGLAATTGKEIVINYGLIAEQAAPFTGDKLDELLGLTIHEVAHDMFTISPEESERRMRRYLRRTGSANQLTMKDMEFAHLLHSIMEDRLVEKWIGEQYPGAKPYIDKLNGQYIPKELTDEILEKVKADCNVNTVYQVLLTELSEKEIRKLPAIARRAYRHKLAVREKMEHMTQAQRLAKTIQLYCWLKKLFGWEHPIDPKEEEQPKGPTNPQPKDDEDIETKDSDKQDGPDSKSGGSDEPQEDESDEDEKGESKVSGSGSSKDEDDEDEEEKDGKGGGSGSDKDEDEEDDDEDDVDDGDAASDGDDDEADGDEQSGAGGSNSDEDGTAKPGGKEDDKNERDGGNNEGGAGSKGSGASELKPEPKVAKVIEHLQKKAKPSESEMKEIQDALSYKMEDITTGDGQRVVMLHPTNDTEKHNKFLNQVRDNLFQLRGKHNINSFIRGQREGTLDKRRLQHVITDGNCFKQIGAKTKTAMQVCLLVDFSGSMNYNSTMEMVVLLHEVFSKVPGLELMILGYYDASAVTIFKICDPRDGILKLGGVRTDGGTPSYEALEAARGQMMKFPLRGKRLLIHVTDGSPNNGMSMGEKVTEIKKCGITTKCIGIGGSFRDKQQTAWYGEGNYCCVEDISEAKTKIPAVVNEFFNL